MTDTDTAISAVNLRVRRDNATILDSISFAVPAGAVIGLVGRNGAGKSTLLRCMAGLTEPDGGACSVLGCPSLALTNSVRERLGYVAQTPDLFEWMSALEHLRVVGRAYPRWSEQRCTQLAAQLDLPLATTVGELSGGDRQKLAVVLALGHDPDLLLLDEPVASLDPLARRDFMRAIFGDRERERAPRTVVISSHILSDLERVVSHVAFMRKGRLQLFESWDGMLENLRLLPASARGVPADAVMCDSRALDHVVADMRLAPACTEPGRALTLDELFVELNS